VSSGSSGRRWRREVRTAHADAFAQAGERPVHRGEVEASETAGAPRPSGDVVVPDLLDEGPRGRAEVLAGLATGTVQRPEGAFDREPKGTSGRRPWPPRRMGRAFACLLVSVLGASSPGCREADRLAGGKRGRKDAGGDVSGGVVAGRR
jgi:hypothetical protein